jgi:tRNA(fMet)-specific endonuclease VapC
MISSLRRASTLVRESNQHRKYAMSFDAQVLHTNLCVRVLGNRPEALRSKFNTEASGLSISSVVLYELLYGAAKSARPVENQNVVEAFAERLEVLEFDADAALHAGEIRADLERIGN